MFSDTLAAAGCARALPTSVHLLLNDKCNARCVFCGGDYFNSRSGRVMTVDKVRVMAEHLHLELFRQATLAGAGDPLVCPDFGAILAFLRAAYPQLSLSLTTNGLALSERVATALVDAGVASVNISLNAGTSATYSRLMQVDGFERVVSNARRLAALRGKRGSHLQIQLSAPILRGNVEELPLIVQLAHELGAESVNAFYCRFYPGEIRNDRLAPLPDAESLYFHQELSDRVVSASERLAARLSIRLHREPLFAEAPAPRRCMWTERELMVGPDGEVYPCGGGELHFRRKVASGAYDFGNALRMPIEAFWNNDSYRAIRVSSRREHGGLVPECMECANMTSHLEQAGHVLQWDGFGNRRAATPAAQSPKDAAVLAAGGTTDDTSLSARPSAPRTYSSSLVSVIVPTHNRPDQLVEAVRSVLAQTYANIEVLVVNDGGEDVRDSLAALDGSGRITCLGHAENRGLAAARNTGIRAARGAYLAYLDDDDRFYPDHVATLVAALEAGPHRVAYTDAYRAHQVLDNGKYVTTAKDLPYSDDFDADRLLECNYVPVLCVAHARECLDKVGLFDESLRRLEDWDLWIRLSRKYAFKHVPKITCEFSWREDGSTMTSTADGAFEEARATILEAYGTTSRLRARTAALERELEQMRGPVSPADVAAAIEDVARCVALLRGRDAALVWGAGAGGRRARRLLESLGVGVCGFVDSDPAKAGTLVDGLPVRQPAELRGGNEGPESVGVAVASIAHAAIAAQLDALGWQRGRDYTVLPAAALVEP